MKLNAQDLKEVVTLTLEHYNQRAEEFWTGTRGHDVSENIAAMLQYIEGAELSSWGRQEANRLASDDFLRFRNCISECASTMTKSYFHYRILHARPGRRRGRVGADRLLTLAEHAAREDRLNGGSLFRDR